MSYIFTDKEYEATDLVRLSKILAEISDHAIICDYLVALEHNLRLVHKKQFNEENS